MDFKTIEDLKENSEKIDEILSIPVPQSLKARYFKTGKALKQSNSRRIHSIMRERITELLNEIEPLISSESA